MQSLRKRTHDIANHVQSQEGLLVLLEERTKVLFKRLGKLEDLNRDVEKLKHQAAVLKWVLGVITAVVVGVLIKVVG